MNMTIHELKQKLKELAESKCDRSTAHILADKYLVDFASQYDPDVEKLFKSIKKHYG